MFVSKHSSSFIGLSIPSVVSVWQILGNGSSAAKISQIEDGMVYFSTAIQTYAFSQQIATCAISSTIESGRVYIFVSVGCGSRASVSPITGSVNFSLRIIAEFLFDRFNVFQKRAVSRFSLLNGTIVGSENGIRYYGAVGAMLCSPDSGVLLVDNVTVALQSMRREFSDSMWFAVGSLVSDTPLASASRSYNDNLDRGWNLIVTRQGQLKFNVSLIDGAIGKFLTAASSSNLVVPQKWTHVLASFNDRSLDVYINGALAARQLIPEAVVFRDVVYSQITVASDSDSGLSILVGATYRGPLLSRFYGVIASFALYGSGSVESDAIQLFSSGTLMTNRLLDVSGFLFSGNPSSVSTVHTLGFANVSIMEHTLNQPMPFTSMSFEIVCASQVVTVACSASIGGQRVTCPLVPANGVFSDSCRDAPFYLIGNSTVVVASSFISTVTLRSSSFMIKSNGSSTNFEIIRDFPEASGSTGSAFVVFLGKQYLFSSVAADDGSVPVSPAYVLQGEQFRRQWNLDVAVAAASAVAALAQASSRGAQNQVISPCLHVAYSSLTDTSFVYKYAGSGSNISLVKTYAIPFIGGAKYVSISPANTKYGSDVVLVSFCGNSGCQLFMLSSQLTPSVKSIIRIDAKNMWMFSPASSNRILIVASSNSNTSSYDWDGSVFDADQNSVIALSRSLCYVTNSSAVSASFSTVGTQDLLFFTSSDTQSIFRFDYLLTKWVLLSSFLSPTSMSTNVVMASPYSSSGATYMSIFAGQNKDVRVLTANVSTSQGAAFVRRLESCSNTGSLFILRTLHAMGMNEAPSAVSWYNISSGIPSLVAELEYIDSMSLLEAYTFAVDCESGFISIAQKDGISLVVANTTSRSLEKVSSITPTSSIFGIDVLSLNSMVFASFPEILPVLVLSSRDRGCVDTFTLSKNSGGFQVADGSTLRDGQAYVNWLTRSSSQYVLAPFNKSLPLWNESIKSFYSFMFKGISYAVLLGRCNDPTTSSPAIVVELVNGNWISRQELPDTRGACIAVACEQIQGSLYLMIGVNAFGNPSQKSIIFELSTSSTFYQTLQYVDTLAAVDVTSFFDSGKCAYVLVQKTDGVLPSGSASASLVPSIRFSAGSIFTAYVRQYHSIQCYFVT